VAIALAEIGRDKLASAVLLHQARIGDPATYDALSRLARDLGMPSTQLYMAYNAPSGGAADPASQYPAPKWVPVTGWRVDPALAYAHTLQESNFRAEAVSPAKGAGADADHPDHGARARPAARAVRRASSTSSIRRSTSRSARRTSRCCATAPATGGALPKIMAAYNAGLTPVTRWNYEGARPGRPAAVDGIDPYWETRSYVAIVMKNYWMYERQAPRRLGEPRGAGRERLAGLPFGRPDRRAGVPFGPGWIGAALMAIDESRAFKPINIALLTVSDTRGPDEDTSGDLLAERITAAGHRLAARAIETRRRRRDRALFNNWIDDPAIDAVVSTGGTGLTGRDVTPEALERVKDKDIEGFGELFRWISYQTIGTSTVQSRACAVVARGTYLFALPGSNGAVKDGWDRILAEQLDSRNAPCNFVELMPRLKEQ
jgi:molybdenum cofactor biosynthesis protein B